MRIVIIGFSLIIALSCGQTVGHASVAATSVITTNISQVSEDHSSKIVGNWGCFVKNELKEDHKGRKHVANITFGPSGKMSANFVVFEEKSKGGNITFNFVYTGVWSQHGDIIEQTLDKVRQRLIKVDLNDATENQIKNLTPKAHSLMQQYSKNLGIVNLFSLHQFQTGQFTNLFHGDASALTCERE